MSIVDDLGKLVALRAAGNLTEEEFAEAKSHVFQAIRPETHAPSAAKLPESVGNGSRPAENVFRSSRWSSGNCFFPDAIILAADGVLFRKRGVAGSNEEYISYKSVASCRVKSGVFLADIAIETAGGSQPIYLNGLWKSDARAIVGIIRGRQAE
jgi:hypothetical protein